MVQSLQINDKNQEMKTQRVKIQGANQRTPDLGVPNPEGKVSGQRVETLASALDHPYGRGEE